MYDKSFICKIFAKEKRTAAKNGAGTSEGYRIKVLLHLLRRSLKN